MRNQGLKSVNVTAVAALLLALSLTSHAEGTLIRYTNDEGVTVLNHTIPPEFAQNGYEILSNTGKVIKVVPPAPSDGEIAEAQAKRQLREKFEVLKRRYSSTEDIQNAKKRRLSNLQTNISILRGNISSVKTRTENLMSEAAEMERTGKPVSANILNQLKDARAELAVAEQALEQRLLEHEEIADRFEQDLATFTKGKQLINQQDIVN